MPGQLQTTDMAELWRIDTRVMVRACKTSMRENHASQLSAI